MPQIRPPWCMSSIRIWIATTRTILGHAQLSLLDLAQVLPMYIYLARFRQMYFRRQCQYQIRRAQETKKELKGFR